MAEFGLVRGLAQDLGYDQKINDLRYREQQDKLAQIQAQNRAKLFADDMDYNTTVSPYDMPLVKQYAQGRVKDIAKFYRDNPDVLYNPEKLAVLNSMKKDLKNNEPLNRGMAYTSLKTEMLKDMQDSMKNHKFQNKKGWEREMQKFKNYDQFGHPEGEAGRVRDGVVLPSYTRPRDFVDNLGGEFQKMGNATKNYDLIQGKVPGEFYTNMRKDDLEKLTDSGLQQFQEQIDEETNALGITDPAQKRQWVRNQIESGFDKQHSLGDPLALRKLAIDEAQLALQKSKHQRDLNKDAAEASQGSTWDFLTNTPSTNIDIPTANLIWGNNAAKIKGANGEQIDLRGLGKWQSEGLKTTINGQPYLIGHVDMPIETAQQKGLVRDDAVFGKDWVPEDNFSDRVQIVNEDKNGKKIQYVRVLTDIPFDPKDKIAKSIFEGRTMAPKYRPAVERTDSSNQVTGTKQQFIEAGYSEEQIQRGIKEGLIKLK